MAIRLTRAEQKRLMELNRRAIDARGKLDRALEVLNIRLQNAVADFNDNALARYNEAVEEAQAFRDQITERLDTEIGKRSDDWRQTDAGENAIEFTEEWSAVDFEEIEVIEIEVIEIDPSEWLDEALEQLPTEVL